jgi:nucleotide-binding universal stress UspA family protein
VGKPYREILRLADELAASMIVMGAHGQHQAGPGFFGSTATHVVRAAECPVLTIRAV